MNQWSVLGRYLPAFRRIVGRMQHDLFHVYTVDQHILMVVRNLRRFAMDEHAHEYPFCSQLMAAFDKPWLLYLAALFHDIAKGRGGDHSRARHERRAPVLPRPRPAADETRTGRVPGRAPSDDVVDRAEAGPVRPRGDRAVRRPGRHRAAPDRAVPADRRRHPRHQPEGLERLERQAAAGPVHRHQAGARRRGADIGHRGWMPCGARRIASSTCTPCSEERYAEFLGQARRRLLPAQRRPGHRLAHAGAAYPRRHRRAGRARTAGADRRGLPGGRLPAGPARAVRAHLRLLRQQEPVGARCAHPHDAARLCARQLPGRRSEQRSLTTATS